MIQNYPEFLDVDVLKVGHHGSKTSSSENFIKAISPEYAFISTPLINRFNFPHEITIKKYSYLEDRLFISGRDGALQINSDGEKAVFKTILSEKCIVDKNMK